MERLDYRFSDNTIMMDSKIVKYWDKNDVESMYDKNLLNAEIDLIKKHIPIKAKILDAGCGEGEGTFVYSSIKGVLVHAVDFSETRLRKASSILKERKNVTLKKVDFLGEYSLDNDYDIIISQRFLINIMKWDLQKKVLLDLMELLKKGGKLLILEGSIKGMDSLNEFRAIYGLEPIPIKWHNLFLDDDQLIEFMSQNGYKLLKEEGMGIFFLLTRGVRPIIDKVLNWDHEFNRISASPQVNGLLGLGSRFSRLKLWVFQK